MPPLNGFVSEWLLLQAFLFTPNLPASYLNMLVPVAAAAIALAAALSAYVMVKFYGIVFLGQPREEKLAQAHDAGILERIGLLWLAAGCVAFGVLPVQVITLIDFVTGPMLGTNPRRPAPPTGCSSRRSTRSAPATVPCCSSWLRHWRCFSHG
jgi:formate hydrogenlyase subunit 3/multisubunit Na+/H+ antiporter MnhD subunit